MMPPSVSVVQVSLSSVLGQGGREEVVYQALARATSTTTAQPDQTILAW